MKTKDKLPVTICPLKEKTLNDEIQQCEECGLNVPLIPLKKFIKEVLERILNLNVAPGLKVRQCTMGGKVDANEVMRIIKQKAGFDTIKSSIK